MIKKVLLSLTIGAYIIILFNKKLSLYSDNIKNTSIYINEDLNTNSEFNILSDNGQFIKYDESNGKNKFLVDKKTFNLLIEKDFLKNSKPIFINFSDCDYIDNKNIVPILKIKDNTFYSLEAIKNIIGRDNFNHISISIFTSFKEIKNKEVVKSEALYCSRNDKNEQVIFNSITNLSKEEINRIEDYQSQIPKL